MFTLTYCSDGAFTAGDVMDMEAEERQWYIKRLGEQLDREAKAAKRGRGGSRAKR